MGTGTLNNRSSGQTILDTFFNDIHGALDGDMVGRGASGIPTALQNLGTLAFPWGSAYITNLVINGSSLDTSQITSPQNRVVSGKTRSTSNQPAYLVPSGSGATATIKGTSTHLLLDINGASVSVSADIALSGLTLAPSSNNTALVNDAAAVGQEATRTWGEFGSSKAITIDTAGSNVTALVGKYASFKIGAEYFYCLVESSTKLSHCMRGFFYDSAVAPKNRVVFSDNDTITLMKTGYVFVTNDGITADVTYNQPTWAFSSPASPVTGDYWYDMTNSVWKRYDGASFQIISRTYIGILVLDSTNCVAARSYDFYAKYSHENSVDLEVATTEIIKGVAFGSKLSVAGVEISFNLSPPIWNITTNLASSADMYNASEQASTNYYAYVSDQGQTVLSDISPYWRADLKGYYHPHNPWRSAGAANNDVSSNIVVASNYDKKTVDYWEGSSSGSDYSKTGSSFGDFTPGGTTVLTARASSGIFATTAGSNLPGLSFAPASIDALYRITAIVGRVSDSDPAANVALQLTDGITAFAQAEFSSFTDRKLVVLSGVYQPSNPLLATIKIQGATGSSTLSFSAGTIISPSPSVQWSIHRIR